MVLSAARHDARERTVFRRCSAIAQLLDCFQGRFFGGIYEAKIFLTHARFGEGGMMETGQEKAQI